MNRKIISFIKNFSYALISNVTSLLVSTILVLILPKIVGVEEYGYWQVYIFYTSYVGFFHFGWSDGIYLRYAGKTYEELDKKVFFSQFWMLVAFQVIVASIIALLAGFLGQDPNKVYIFRMMALCCLIVIPRALLEYTLQFTNRIQEYSKILLLDRILYCFLMLAAVLLGVRNFKYLVALDLVAKSVAFVYAIYFCKDIVLRRRKDFKVDMKETYQNLSVGIKLMFANVASMLIMGIVRLCIENTWSVEVFGKISLTISVCNMMMILISALGLVIFPVVSRMTVEKMRDLYQLLRDLLVLPLLGVLVVYFPAKFFLTMWLPQYEEGLKYMAILFPICLCEGKMSLLINTYLKALRKEKMMLGINLSAVCLSTLCSLVFIIIGKNLTMGVFTILIVLVFRAVVAEVCLSKVLNIKIYKKLLFELLMIGVFVITGYCMNNWSGMAIYFVCYVIFLFTQKNAILNVMRQVRGLLKGEF